MSCPHYKDAHRVHTVQMPKPNRVWFSAGISPGQKGKRPPTICSQSTSNFLLIVIKWHYIVRDCKYITKYTKPNFMSHISVQLLSTVTSAPSSSFFFLFFFQKCFIQMNLLPLISGNTENQPFLNSLLWRAVWNGSLFSHRHFAKICLHVSNAQIHALCSVITEEKNQNNYTFFCCYFAALFSVGGYFKGMSVYVSLVRYSLFYSCRKIQV